MNKKIVLLTCLSLLLSSCGKASENAGLPSDTSVSVSESTADTSETAALSSETENSSSETMTVSDVTVTSSAETVTEDTSASESAGRSETESSVSEDVSSESSEETETTEESEAAEEPEEVDDPEVVEEPGCEIIYIGGVEYIVDEGEIFPEPEGYLTLKSSDDGTVIVTDEDIRLVCEYFPELESITILSSENVKDLSPLSKMKNLKSVTVNGCGLNDLSFAAEISGLESLTVDFNNISDLSPLKKCKSLKYLSAWYNPVSSEQAASLSKALPECKIEYDEMYFEYINHPEKYVYLDVYDLPVYVDVNEKELTNIIWIGDSNLNEISQKMKKLENLEIGYTTLSSIEALSKMPCLKRISFICVNVKDKSSFKKLTNLECIKISESGGYEDISFFSGLGTLKELFVTNCEVKLTKPLENMDGLKKLYLSYNDITDVSGLAGLKNLEYLDLSHNKISDITPLKKLTGLTGLDISGNGISQEDVNALSEALPDCIIAS